MSASSSSTKQPATRRPSVTGLTSRRPSVTGSQSEKKLPSSATTGSTTATSSKLTPPQPPASIARVRVPQYVDIDVHRNGHPITLYPFEVLYTNGKLHKVSKRYSDVLNFHATLQKAAPNDALVTFNFPHKSWMHTSAEFTKERRRSGFEEYFELLLRLGEQYAPFVFTFLQHGELRDENDFDELGGAGTEPKAEDLANGPQQSNGGGLQRSGSLTKKKQDSRSYATLVRASSLVEWVCYFYVPVSALTLVYLALLHLLGVVVEDDWRRGAPQLAVATSPLLLCVAFALLSPLVQVE